ncbi:hypothetical protein YYG_04627 [Plasmodium vinckei petteri]|uniref:PIR protein CIR protein n=1 Tax=Plasmodium vinckei petteri TaxID=138298 RepID=W7ANK5_PLAVN|nr:hypothetical protein YYG_04627 [Plasmodium vinckei petteri]
MKRVINFHDGNRKTKIIISSYDNKKDLKPVINSVGGKKGPLLNIYKLIRADPMPFINLFFFEFNKIDREFGVKNDGSEFANALIIRYCPYRDESGYGICLSYLQSARSGVINLLENLEKYNLDYDKLAEYAILFLSYKLKQNPSYSGTKLNDFYTNHIVNNKDYNKKINGNDGLTFKEIINRKKDLMNMNIKERSKFNDPFSILVLLYNEIKNNKLDCTKYSSYPENFANKFKELNEDSNINGNTSYRKLLSTLSDDYNNLKNKYEKTLFI